MRGLVWALVSAFLVAASIMAMEVFAPPSAVAAGELFAAVIFVILLLSIRIVPGGSALAADAECS